MTVTGRWPDREIAETDQLLLFVPGGGDAARMAAYAERNREYHRHAMPVPPEDWATRTFWHRRLLTRLSDYEHKRLYSFVLVEKDKPDGEIIGDCTFSQVVRQPMHTAVLGYKIDERYAGRGLMREALQAALQFMFSDVGLHRVEAGVRPENNRSYHLLKRLGFVLEGYSKSYLRLDGKWRDHLRLAKLNPDHPDAPGTNLTLEQIGVPVPE
jgi:ribosomal-protein-alanine N-acetyltransferase